MPGPFATAFKNALLDHGFGGPDYTRLATVYVGLFEAGTEVSGGSYARVAVTNNATNFPAASGGVKTTGADITFPTPSAGWGTPDATRFYDASSGGNLLATGTLTAPLNTIVAGNSVVLPAGSITLTLTDPS